MYYSYAIWWSKGHTICSINSSIIFSVISHHTDHTSLNSLTNQPKPGDYMTLLYSIFNKDNKKQLHTQRQVKPRYVTLTLDRFSALHCLFTRWDGLSWNLERAFLFARGWTLMNNCMMSGLASLQVFFTFHIWTFEQQD